MHSGASMRELYGALEFHMHYLFALTYISCNNSLIPNLLHLQILPVKLQAENAWGRGYRISNVCWYLWSNITWVCANLRFIVHTLCHHCEIVATAAGNKLRLEGWQVKDESSTSWYTPSVYIFQSTITGVVVWGFRNSSVAVGQVTQTSLVPVLTS